MSSRATGTSPRRRRQTFTDGWLHTGDLVRIDEEGFLYILDRAKDMLIRGGENVYCVEVEDALYSHPAVMDAAVIGIPHRVLGEEVGAVVQVKPGAEIERGRAASAMSRRALAAFKVPVAYRAAPRAAAAQRQRQDPEARAARPVCVSERIHPRVRSQSVMRILQ